MDATHKFSTSPKKTIYHHYEREVVTAENGEESSTTGMYEVDYSKIKYPMIDHDYNELPTYPERPHFHEHHFNMKPATQVVVFDGCPNDPHHPASMPIYQTATFVQPSATEFGPYDYTRSGNPTRTALETLVAGLENAYSAFAFSSGMAALSTITRLVKTGEEIIACDDLYGGMYRLLTKVTSLRCGIKVTFTDVTNLTALEEKISSKTKLVHVESPSNPLMRVTDISALADFLHSKGVLLSVDVTMMSPVCMRALDLGADIVIHSGTKFLSGHSDVIMGIVGVKTEELAKEIAFFQNAEGTGLSPFDCWLSLRGMKTMSLRVTQAQKNALKVAKYLCENPMVEDVHYAGLPPTADKPWQKRDRDQETREREYSIQTRQASGGGCVLSFTTGSVDISTAFVDALRLFKITVSFGSCNSLVELPCLLSHATIPKDQRTFPQDLVRMSIGIEDITDIIGDISQAFAQASHLKKPTENGQ